MNMLHAIRTWLTRRIWLLPSAAAGLLVALGLATCRAQPPARGESTTVAGRVERMTTAPRGEIDGAILADGTRLHWPPHLQDQFANVVKPGDKVEAEGRTEVGPEGDRRMELKSVKNTRTEKTAENADFDRPGPGPGGRGKHRPPHAAGPHGHKPPARDRKDLADVAGTVERLTTAPRGEVDGAVLDDGTWIHWPPHLQDRFVAVVKKGDKVRAEGFPEKGPAGDARFEVTTVTNVKTEATADNPDLVAGPAAPNEPRSEADQDRRLRDLERQVEQLRKDLAKLLDK